MATTDRLSGFDIGVAVKPACAVATTGNITLDSTQVIDGVAVGASERVLVKDQTDATENGIYIAQSSSWLRAKDFDGQRDALPGTFVYVDRGTENAATFWVAESSSTALSITIGSSIAFTKINPSLSGVSSFSNDTLLPTTTAGGWRSALGIVEPGDSLITSTSTGDARSAIDAQEDVITTRGDLVHGSTAGAAGRLALGTQNFLLASNGSDATYVGGVSSRSSSFSITSTNNRTFLSITASATDLTISLPAAATGGDGLIFTAQRTDDSTNTLVFNGSGAETIDGSTTLSLTNQYESITLVCDGTGWHRASSFNTPRLKSLYAATQPSSAGSFDITATNFMSAERIEIMTHGVEISTAANILLTVGDASDFTTGNSYSGGTVDESGVTAIAWESAGPAITAASSGFGYDCRIELVRLPDADAVTMFGSSLKAWNCRLTTFRSTGAATDRGYGEGYIVTSKTVDRLRFSAASGSFASTGHTLGLYE